jgi:hypothetical protein
LVPEVASLDNERHDPGHHVSAQGPGDDQHYEPPARVLSLAVIGSDAHLAIYEHGPKEREAEPVASIEVPARSGCWP